MELDPYMAYHGKRFDYLMRIAERFFPSRDATAIDVGPGPLTKRLADRYATVHSMGIDSPIFDANKPDAAQHIVFDLSRCTRKDEWIALPQVDFVMFSEVIEHVYCPADAMLRFLATALKPGGAIVCSTPNIAAFHKRVRSAFGKTPWHRWESGHLTEFSRQDFEVIARRAGLRIVHHEFGNYFGTDGSALRRKVVETIDAVTGVIPDMRRGQLVLLGHG
ncbi:MAG: class I SAM-dependent methyltransferase [Burkholderiales bacterium]|nr:class I SAM-dependent methyltransferase [Burkholderiales bacterium]